MQDGQVRETWPVTRDYCKIDGRRITGTWFFTESLPYLFI